MFQTLEQVAKQDNKSMSGEVLRAVISVLAGVIVIGLLVLVISLAT